MSYCIYQDTGEKYLYVRYLFFLTVTTVRLLILHASTFLYISDYRYKIFQLAIGNIF